MFVIIREFNKGKMMSEQKKLRLTQTVKGAG